MTNSAVAGLCRLRFHTPQAAFELAVPADVPLADLLPAVLSYAGGELAEQGLDHGGWVLQRLGDEPLDEEQSADALELRDGDTSTCARAAPRCRRCTSTTWWTAWPPACRNAATAGDPN